MVFGAFFVFLLVSSVSLPAHGNELVINTLLDILLDDITENLSDSSATTINLPDIEDTYKVSFFSLGITAANGVFGDLSSLARSGDASLVLTDNAATINVSVTFDTMEIVYADTTIVLGKTTVTDSLNVTLAENSVGIVAELLVLDEGCQVSLVSATIGELGGIEITMAGLGEETVVIEALTNWIIDNFNNKIKTLVEDKITSIVQKELESFDICSVL